MNKSKQRNEDGQNIRKKHTRVIELIKFQRKDQRRWRENQTWRENGKRKSRVFLYIENVAKKAKQVERET